jgi:hypothetical protein
VGGGVLGVPFPGLVRLDKFVFVVALGFFGFLHSGNPLLMYHVIPKKYARAATQIATMTAASGQVAASHISFSFFEGSRRDVCDDVTLAFKFVFYFRLGVFKVIGIADTLDSSWFRVDRRGYKEPWSVMPRC